MFSKLPGLAGALLFSLSVQAADLAGLPGEINHDVLITGFALNHPEQFQDVQDVAQGFPRELAHRLEQVQMMKVKRVPELLSTGWTLGSPDKKLLTEMSNLHHARYIVAGSIVNGGEYEVPVLFGLFSKHFRSFAVEIHIYDASSGKSIQHLNLSADVRGDSEIGRQQVFGGAGFAATAYGKTILGVVDQAVQAITASLAMQP